MFLAVLLAVVSNLGVSLWARPMGIADFAGRHPPSLWTRAQVREFLYLDKAKQNRVTLEDFRAAYETTVHGKVRGLRKRTLEWHASRTPSTLRLEHNTGVHSI